MFTDRVERIIKRYSELAQVHGSMLTLWQELAELIIPRKSDMVGMIPAGTKRTDKLFDSTAVHSNELLAAAMQGTITNHATRWFGLRMRNDELNEIKEIKDWLEVCADRMYQAFNQSNFHSEVHEIYLDLGAFGTGGLFMEKKKADGNSFSGFNFKAMSLKEFCIAEDAEGSVNALYRKFSLSLYDIVKEYGAKALGDDTGLIEKLTTNPYTKYEILQCVYPRGFPNVDRGNKGMPFESIHILLKHKRILRESGYEEFPYMVPRWTKVTGQIWGNGPGNTALPDIRTLNRAVELTLKALAKNIDPPVEVLDETVVGGTVDMTAGGVNVVREKAAINPIVIRGQWDFANLEMGKLQSSIRRIFFADQLQLQEGPQMTAHEVAVRYELMQRLLGPTLGRLERELLNPLIERAFGMMLRAGALPPPPDAIQQAIEAGEEIDIEYESPLALAQRAQELQGIERALSVVLPLLEHKPELADNYDFDKLVRHISMLAGMPAKLLADMKKVKEMRQGRQKARQNAADLEQDRAGAESLGKLAPMVKALQQQGHVNKGTVDEAV